MIPRLYEKAASSTVSIAGPMICPLDELTVCKVTEERNGEYYLEAEYPLDARNIGQLMVDRMVYAKPNRADNPDWFRISKLQRSLTGTVKITAYHNSYDLKGFVLEPMTATYTTAADALNALKWLAKPQYVIGGRYTFYSDTSTITTTIPALSHYPHTFREIMGGIAGSILDIYGGEWKYEQNKIYLKSARGKDSGKRIIYGANMVGLNQEISTVDSAYQVLPYYAQDEDNVIIGSIEANGSSSYTPPFAYTKIVDITQDWNSINGDTPPANASDISGFVAPRIGRYTKDPETAIDAEYIELSDSAEYSFLNDGSLGLCDLVTVIHPASGLNLKAKVVKTVYNALTGRYDQIVIGTIKKDLIDILRRIK